MASPASDPELTLERLSHSLRSPTPSPPEIPFWHHRSHQDPHWFWSLLFQERGALAARRPTSVFGDHIDLFSDIVALSHGNRAPAWRHYDGAQAHEVSYQQLFDAATQVAESFRAQGVKPGQTICFVRRVDLKLLVGLLAAWRLGAIVSLLPPDGSLYVRRRLRALVPDWVDLDRFHLALLDNLEFASLRRDVTSSQEILEDRPYSYPAGSVAARLFDRAEGSLKIGEISAQTLYFGALRDGLLALGLRPGQMMASVDLDMVQTQPSLILAVLLASGTYLQVNVEELDETPMLLAQPLRSVGLSVRAREELLRHQPSIGEQWGMWFRDPGEDADVGRWEEMVAQLNLGKTWSANLRWEACFGGCTLISHKRRQAHAFVFVTPGVSWDLRNIVDPEEPAFGGVGVLAVASPSSSPGDVEGFPTRNIIARGRNTMIYAESAVLGHWGRGLDSQDVFEALEDIIPEFPVSLVQLPWAGRVGSPNTILLVFCGNRKPSLDLRQTIEGALEGRLGEVGLLDHIELLPLWPRRDDEGHIDHDFYARELATGSVHRAASDPLMRKLALLRQGVEAKWHAKEKNI
ncbi:MAG: AMP-binding protein [Deltaproteobacteria bacterium]|nr:AMP-binding protein [Deltaproteobacteria bacterium]